MLKINLLLITECHFKGYEGYNKKSLKLICKGSKTILNVHGDLDSAINQCTVKKSCNAVFDHGCNGKHFFACKDVKVNLGLSAGCTYQKRTLRIINVV